MLITLVDIIYRRLLALLQSALWNKPVDSDLFAGMEEEDWYKLFRTTIEQGVMALTFDGIMREPAKFTLPRKLKLTWAANVENLEQRYNRQRAVAGELTAILKNEDIPMLLFKGLALAEHYPIPQHREFGDLDIYLFGQDREGEQCMLKHGVQKGKHPNTEKHSALQYKGVPIENHHYFLSEQHLKHVRQLKNCLRERVGQDVPLRQALPEQLLFPPADFHALFLICHTLRHFTRCINLRYLCDWAVFLTANSGKIDVASYRAALSEAGWLKPADAFTAITVELFNLDAEVALMCQPDAVLEEKMLNDLLHAPRKPASSSAWAKIKFYYWRMMSERWKYELLYPGRWSYWLLHSFFFHLRHPVSFFTRLFSDA